MTQKKELKMKRVHYITITALNIKMKIIINNPCNGTDYKLYIKVIIVEYAYMRTF